MTEIYDAVFAVAAALEGPVVVLALLALVLVIVESGRFAVESLRRRRRSLDDVVAAVAAGDPGRLAHDPAMQRVVRALVDRAPESRIAKELADFDFTCERRLARTRLLVRLGPALGLMGTLIPLSPALEGLADGDVATLTDNLRVAFSITVLGLLVGAIAFALSLARERMYGQDYSDLEYAAAELTRSDP